MPLCFQCPTRMVKRSLKIVKLLTGKTFVNRYLQTLSIQENSDIKPDFKPDLRHTPMDVC